MLLPSAGSGSAEAERCQLQFTAARLHWRKRHATLQHMLSRCRSCELRLGNALNTSRYGMKMGKQGASSGAQFLDAMSQEMTEISL